MRFDPVEEPSPRFPGRSFAVPFVLTSHLQTSNATRLLVRVFPAPPAYLKSSCLFLPPTSCLSSLALQGHRSRDEMRQVIKRPSLKALSALFSSRPGQKHSFDFRKRNPSDLLVVSATGSMCNFLP